MQSFAVPRLFPVLTNVEIGALLLVAVVVFSSWRRGVADRHLVHLGGARALHPLISRFG